jgi:hypothetical protein
MRKRWNNLHKGEQAVIVMGLITVGVALVLYWAGLIP